MKISYSYRGKEAVIYNGFGHPCITLECEVKFRELANQNMKKKHEITIQPHELLATAQACIKAINKIAGTSHKIVTGKDL